MRILIGLIALALLLAGCAWNDSPPPLHSVIRMQRSGTDTVAAATNLNHAADFDTNKLQGAASLSPLTIQSPAPNSPTATSASPSGNPASGTGGATSGLGGTGAGRASGTSTVNPQPSTPGSPVSPGTSVPGLPSTGNGTGSTPSPSPSTRTTSPTPGTPPS